MAHLPPVDSANRTLLLKTIQHIAECDTIIKKYKDDDESMAKLQASLQRQLNEIEFRRKATSKALKSAELSKKVAESTAKQLRRISPPINYLPEDILAQIFHILVVDEVQRHKIQLMECNALSFDKIPLILGHVCSYWRSIVLQYSKMWDCVLLVTPELNSTAKNLSFVRIWLSRGTRSAQSIFMDGWTNNSSSQYLTSLLGPSPIPFKSAHIEARGFATTVQWDINAIRAKEVSISRKNGNEPLGFYMPLMQNATFLTICGTSPEWQSVQWPSLKSLTLRSFPTRPGAALLPPRFISSDFRPLLEAAPNLVDLEVDAIAVRSPSDGMQTVRHASLSSMSIYLSHLETNVGPFDFHLDAPSLSHLKFISFHRHDPTSLDLLVAEWNQPTKLSLSNLNEIHVPISLALFHKLPSLDTLQLEGNHIDAILAGIIPTILTNSETATLPLHKLRCIILKGTDIRGKTLVELLEARLALIRRGTKDFAAIADVSLYNNSGITVDDWKRVKDLLEMGTGDRV